MARLAAQEAALGLDTPRGGESPMPPGFGLPTADAFDADAFTPFNSMVGSDLLASTSKTALYRLVETVLMRAGIV